VQAAKDGDFEGWVKALGESIAPQLYGKESAFKVQPRLTDSGTLYFETVQTEESKELQLQQYLALASIKKYGKKWNLDAKENYRYAEPKPEFKALNLERFTDVASYDATKASEWIVKFGDKDPLEIARLPEVKYEEARLQKAINDTLFTVEVGAYLIPGTQAVTGTRTVVSALTEIGLMYGSGKVAEYAQEKLDLGLVGTIGVGVLAYAVGSKSVGAITTLASAQNLEAQVVAKQLSKSLSQNTSLTGILASKSKSVTDDLAKKVLANLNGQPINKETAYKAVRDALVGANFAKGTTYAKLSDDVINSAADSVVATMRAAPGTANAAQVAAEAGKANQPGALLKAVRKEGTVTSAAGDATKAQAQRALSEAEKALKPNTTVDNINTNRLVEAANRYLAENKGSLTAAEIKSIEQLKTAAKNFKPGQDNAADLIARLNNVHKHGTRNAQGKYSFGDLRIKKDAANQILADTGLDQKTAKNFSNYLMKENVLGSADDSVRVMSLDNLGLQRMRINESKPNMQGVKPHELYRDFQGTLRIKKNRTATAVKSSRDLNFTDGEITLFGIFRDKNGNLVPMTAQERMVMSGRNKLTSEVEKFGLGHPTINPGGNAVIGGEISVSTLTVDGRVASVRLNTKSQRINGGRKIGEDEAKLAAQQFENRGIRVDEISYWDAVASKPVDTMRPEGGWLGELGSGPIPLRKAARTEISAPFGTIMEKPVILKGRETLGNGAEGKVYKVTMPDGRELALKVRLEGIHKEVGYNAARADQIINFNAKINEIIPNNVYPLIGKTKVDLPAVGADRFGLLSQNFRQVGARELTEINSLSQREASQIADSAYDMYRGLGKGYKDPDFFGDTIIWLPNDTTKGRNLVWDGQNLMIFDFDQTVRPWGRNVPSADPIVNQKQIDKSVQELYKLYVSTHNSIVAKSPGLYLSPKSFSEFAPGSPNPVVKPGFSYEQSLLNLLRDRNFQRK